MKKPELLIIIIFLFMAIGGMAFAQAWVLIGKGDAGEPHYIAPQSLKKQGNKVTYIKLVVANDTIRNIMKTKGGLKEDLDTQYNLIEEDCVKHTNDIKNVKMYNKSKKIIMNEDLPSNPVDSYLSPLTKAAYNYVCKGTTSPKR